jgi:hypothetical protein
MPTYLPFVLALVVAGLVVWSLAGHYRRRRARKAALAQLGFDPCPDRKGWLEETVTRIENNRAYRYEVREPKRLRGDPDVYFYVKVRHRHPQEDAMVEEEVLFPLKRPSAAGLFLTMKPTALPAGLATRALSAMATGPWDAQPDDLQRLELPPDLKDSNLLAALGPPGARLHDLVDSGMLSLAQGLGDAGGTFVRFREAWCTVAGAGAQIPFRVDEIVARIRPALRGEPGSS